MLFGLGMSIQIVSAMKILLLLYALLRTMTRPTILMLHTTWVGMQQWNSSNPLLPSLKPSSPIN